MAAPTLDPFEALVRLLAAADAVMAAAVLEGARGHPPPFSLELRRLAEAAQAAREVIDR